jgi:hypothetical protein
VVFLYGDVYFSDAAMDIILRTSPVDYAYFQRTKGSRTTGKTWKEGFAMSVKDVGSFLGALELLRKKIGLGAIRDCHHLVQGYLEEGRTDDYWGIGPHGVEIDDETDDFDVPEDIEIWLDHTKNLRVLPASAEALRSSLREDRSWGIDYSIRGVTVVCGCRDRATDLASVITTWTHDPRVTELVLVDFGSRQEDEDKISELAGAAAACRLPGKLLRVVLVRAAGEATWQPGPCFNLGLRFATCDEILKLDADVALLARPLPGGTRTMFWGEHALGEGDFFAGDWLRARNDNERHLSGVVYARRRDLLAVNGWNERITTYGYDDSDLYERLSKAGLKRKNLNNDTLYHIPHSDTIRLQSQPRRVSLCWQETGFNRQMSVSKPWQRDDGLIDWAVVQLARPDYVTEYRAERRTTKKESRT